MAFNPKNRKLDKNGNPIVTKEELEESGLSLRDFLNKERGLTRRRDGNQESVGGTPEFGKYKPRYTPAPMAPMLVEGGKRTPFGRPPLNEPENPDATSETFKRGGKVKASSASKRADGIAQRGKTRGRMV
jgi:hypothetical protein